jgi:hypothetical protein
VIVNGGVERDQQGPSLWLEVADSTRGLRLTSVAGNALFQTSDLSDLQRHLSPPTTWSPYNADPV